ncbi:MAG: HAD-IIIC family phosphatase [Alloprevotella sp.]
MLTFSELKRLSRTAPEHGAPLRMALLGDTATQFLATALKGWATATGFALELYEAGFNAIREEVMNPESELHRFNPRYTVVFLSTHKWLVEYGKADASRRAHWAEERLEWLREMRECLTGRIICLNMPEIDDAVHGFFANAVESSFLWQTRKLNFSLMLRCREWKDFYVCDLAALQAKMGRDNMFDAPLYALTEMVLTADAAATVAARITDIVAAAEGKLKKCLILDLDNTLWGGTVGDDGWEGIELGGGMGLGKIFCEFQLWAKKLRQRGIILCICSKNDEEKAKEPFEKHPEMMLRLEDISLFTANWENKADNIRHIAETLHIGLDSMVFIDDNPFERQMVRSFLPEVTVPEMPEDPALWLEFLYSQNLFETVSLNKEDEERTRRYREQAERTAFGRQFKNEEDFLRSLEMKSRVEGFTNYNTPRVAQLSQRSNQFNLRTVRYTEDEVRAMAADARTLPLTFTLEDRFGASGLVCTVIMKEQDGETLFIDTWFMSCRVLKRGLENFVLNRMVCAARKRGYRRLVGEYIPTAKNALVSHHYEDLGFTPLGENRFELRLENYVPRKCEIEEKVTV